MLIGNLVKNNGDYCILLLVDGRWQDVGIACGSFVEAMDIADRSLDQLYVNLPTNEGFDNSFAKAA